MVANVLGVLVDIEVEALLSVEFVITSPTLPAAALLLVVVPISSEVEEKDRLVAEAAPKTGVTRVGLVERTLFPEPVLVVTPVPPFKTGNAVPDNVTAKVPEVVIGDPEMLKKVGTVIATLVTVPAPAGVDQVPSPRQKVEELAEVPEFRWVTPRFPVTSEVLRLMAPVVRNPLASLLTGVEAVKAASLETAIAALLLISALRIDPVRLSLE